MLLPVMYVAYKAYIQRQRTRYRDARTGKRHFSGAGAVMLIMCIKGQRAYL